VALIFLILLLLLLLLLLAGIPGIWINDTEEKDSLGSV